MYELFEYYFHPLSFYSGLGIRHSGPGIRPIKSELHSESRLKHCISGTKQSYTIVHVTTVRVEVTVSESNQGKKKIVKTINNNNMLSPNEGYGDPGIWKTIPGYEKKIYRGSFGQQNFFVHWAYVL